MVSNVNSKVNNPEVRDKKCATCRHYEPSPLRRRGWCRNPLLYDRHTNHLVEEDTLACSRGFGSIDYWEPLILRDGRTALTRREKEQARAVSLEVDREIGEAQEEADSTSSLPTTQATMESQRTEPAPLPTNTIPPTIVEKPIRNPNRVVTAPTPTVLRSVGNPLPSPNDDSRSRLRQRFTRKKAPLVPMPAMGQIPAPPPLTFGRRVQIFLYARPWLLLLAILLIVGGAGGVTLARNGGFSSLPIVGSIFSPKPTAVLLPTATATIFLINTPLPTVAVLPTSLAQPATATPSPLPPTALAVGVYAQTTGSLNVRAEASTKGAKLATLGAGVTVKIVDGPKQAGGIAWWKVTNLPGQPSEASGWCSGQFLKPVAPPKLDWFEGGKEGRERVSWLLPPLLQATNS